MATSQCEHHSYLGLSDFYDTSLFVRLQVPRITPLIPVQTAANAAMASAFLLIRLKPKQTTTEAAISQPLPAGRGRRAWLYLRASQIPR